MAEPIETDGMFKKENKTVLSEQMSKIGFAKWEELIAGAKKELSEKTVPNLMSLDCCHGRPDEAQYVFYFTRLDERQHWSLDAILAMVQLTTSRATQFPPIGQKLFTMKESAITTKTEMDHMVISLARVAEATQRLKDNHKMADQFRQMGFDIENCPILYTGEFSRFSFYLAEFPIDLPPRENLEKIQFRFLACQDRFYKEDLIVGVSVTVKKTSASASCTSEADVAEGYYPVRVGYIPNRETMTEEIMHKAGLSLPVPDLSTKVFRAIQEKKPDSSGGNRLHR